MNNTKTVLNLIDEDAFDTLFIEELGWDRPVSTSIPFNIGNEIYELIPVASYRGIQVWACASIPNARVQREIDKSISAVSAERLIIFYDKAQQNWRWPMSRESSGKGIVRLVNHEHIKGNSTLSLIQRLNLLKITLSEEPPSLVEMLLRLRKAFDADQITKNFYREFATYQKQLVTSISGLEKIADKEWYSSLLMNRLMFIYFMQWKGFMDGNQNYLADRLVKVRSIKGPNNFYEFFSDFLLPLFHEGLGAGNKIEIPKEIAEVVGKIPYVNGGIFSEHELEAKNEIRIPDEAFESIFAFFDKYQWHLDSRRSGNPNEINPDVLGYVFEQFVNNKEKGAYYTREDITDYMTSNVLVIKLLQRIEAECSINLLRPLSQNVKRYIWPSLNYGMENRDLIPTTSDFASMEKKAPPTLGLPAETFWETAERFEYCENLHKRISNGEISSISELILLNIDLESLASDIIDGLDTSEDVIRIWKILSSLKIVDPTCGSGAFLFAALNQLQHLYSVLLDVVEIHEKTAKNSELTALLGEVRKHPNRDYFVLKHAAQKNLFGVDLMKEATEIARLRLFLKLISAIEKFEDIEPLPDLEFNIKSGNLLIGITQSERLPEHMNTLDASTLIEDIFTKRDHLADLWENFVTSQEIGHSQAIKAKKMLTNGTIILRNTLDELFYESSSGSSRETLSDWKEKSSPFHWFIEFPEVFQDGGFDIVIGNPPYISKNKISYSIKGHQTSECPDIYAMCMERACQITKPDGAFAMIVMSNLVFSSRYLKLREVLSNRFATRYISGFAKIPAALFEGVKVRNTIFIGLSGEKALFSAPMYRWVQEFRPNLMQAIRYGRVAETTDKSLTWPFVTSTEISDLFNSLKGSLKDEVLSRGPDITLSKGIPVWDKTLGNMAPLFYQGSAYNRISVSKLPPPVQDAEGDVAETSMQKVMWFKSEETRDLAFTLFVSKWTFAWWAMYGDDFHVTQDNLLSFPLDIKKVSQSDFHKLVELSKQMNESMTKNLKWKKNAGLNIGSWELTSSREILVEIDETWASIFKASKLLPKLNYQYFATVKTAVGAEETVIDDDEE